MKLKSLLFGAMLMASTAASAITYSGSFAPSNNFGLPVSAFVNYTITTDGTLGALAPNNFTGYTISATYNNGTPFTSSGTGVFQNSGFGASATATTLSFDYSANSSGLIIFDGNQAICFNGSNFSCIGEPSSSRFYFDIASGVYSYLPSSSGVEVIGTVGAAPIPEPANWALLIAGFGLVGAFARRRAAVAA